MKISLRKYKSSNLEEHSKLLVQNGIYKSVKIAKGKEISWLKKTLFNYNKYKPEFYVLGIFLNKKLIGNIIAEKIVFNDKLEIGFWIGKKYWGKGYTTKALKLFLNRIIKKFEPKSIIAKHNPNNLVSGKVLEKSGFKLKSKGKKEITWKLNL